MSPNETENLKKSYQVPGTAIIYELLDQEIILANLEKGVYYSIRESGVPVWQLLVAGYPIGAIREALEQKYSGDFSISIDSFLHQLLSENLLVELLSEKEAPISSDPFWPKEYQPPLFAKYEEMKNLLMIDPIHEVDAQGWPSRF